MDPESTLLLSIDVGERTLAMAQDVVHQVTQELSAGLCAPVPDRRFSGIHDGVAEPLWAMGATATPPGAEPDAQARWMPLPQLLYAQVVKTLRRRRIIAVTHRVVFGTKAAVEQGAVCRSSRQAKGVRCIPVLGLPAGQTLLPRVAHELGTRAARAAQRRPPGAALQISTPSIGAMMTSATNHMSPAQSIPCSTGGPEEAQDDSHTYPSGKITLPLRRWASRLGAQVCLVMAVTSMD